MNTIEAVIFDWAGTVIDFGSRAPIEAFRAAFQAEGFPVSEAEARRPMGRAKRDHIAAVLADPEVAERWERQMNTPITDEVVDRIYQKFLPLQLDVILRHCDLIPGVIETCRWLSDQGIRIGSSTGYTREIMNAVCEVVQPQGFAPEYIGTASDPHPGRPAPWLIYRNCEHLNVYPMRSVVKVDDTTVGIKAGKNAGCYTVGVAASGNLVGLSLDDWQKLTDSQKANHVARASRILRDAGADAVVETVADLPDLLTRLHAQRVADTVKEVFDARGSGVYGSEAVTQQQHALQAAQLAERENADDELVAAALLHDIGHVLGSDQLPMHDEMNLDDCHEELGYRWLSDNFASGVCDPVRLHVAAKRYLCTTDPSYQDQLSPTSLKSFHDQGGVMNPDEITEFESEPHCLAGLRLRKWDDLAKDPDMSTKSIADYLDLITGLVKPASRLR